MRRARRIPAPGTPAVSKANYPVLSRYATDLTELAAATEAKSYRCHQRVSRPNRLKFFPVPEIPYSLKILILMVERLPKQ